MRVIKHILLIALLALSVGCRKTSQEESPSIATVGKARLHISDLRSMFSQNPSLELSAVKAQNFIQRWTEKELIYQHAVNQGFLADAEIRRKLRDFERDYVYALYVQKFVDEKITITDEELSAYYNEHPQEFTLNETRFDLQIILVDNMSTASACYNSITGGQNFGTLARENSLDDSKSREGKIGWTNLAGFPDEVRRRVPSLPLRQISQPIQTPLGIFLVQVLGVRQRGEMQTLEEAREVIAWKIKTYKREDEYKEFVRQLQESNKVSIDWELLDSLEIKK